MLKARRLRQTSDIQSVRVRAHSEHILGPLSCKPDSQSVIGESSEKNLDAERGTQWREVETLLTA